MEKNLLNCRINIDFFVDHSFKVSQSVNSTIEEAKERLVKLTKVILFKSVLKDEPHSNEYSFNIIFSSNQYIRSLNKAYRNYDEPTDVLTFSYEGNCLSKTPSGEIYISVDMAMKQAFEHGLKLAQELCILSIHGVLHALGLDHERSEAEAVFMKERESQLLKRIGLSHIAPLTCV